MHTLHISGHKRTSEDFLTNLFKPFVLNNDNKPFTLLKTFCTYSVTKLEPYTININENKRELKIGYPFRATMVWPNIFGNGEVFKLGFSRGVFFSFEKILPRFGSIFNIRYDKLFGLGIRNNTWGVEFACKVDKSNTLFQYNPLHTTSKRSLRTFIEGNEVYKNVGKYVFSYFNQYFTFKGGITSHRRPFLKFNIPFMLELQNKVGFINTKIKEEIIMARNCSTFTGLKSEVGILLPPFKAVEQDNQGLECLSKTDSRQKAGMYMFYATCLKSNHFNILDTLSSFCYAQFLQPKIKNFESSIGVGLRVPINNSTINIMYTRGLVWNEDDGISFNIEI